MKHCIKHCTGKVAGLLKLQFLESINRYKKLFEDYPPQRIYVFVKRIECGRNGVFTGQGSAMTYAWYIWDSDKVGDGTRLYWIPNHKRSVLL